MARVKFYFSMIAVNIFLSTLFFFKNEARADDFITVASTTSTRNSGLYEYLLPIFEKQTGIKVHIVAVGTGQAIRIAMNGDADVLLTHHRESEEKFVEAGFGIKRFDLMYNDFILIGPKADPANVRDQDTIATAFKSIAKNKSSFVSRGDESGTHKKELLIWKTARVNLTFSPNNKWYNETGSGMGAALNVATNLSAYVLSDRATWLQFQNKGDLKILFENDSSLFNQYGIIVVNPEQHPHIKKEKAQKFVKWMLSDFGQKKIADFDISGYQAFYPNYKK